MSIEEFIYVFFDEFNVILLRKDILGDILELLEEMYIYGEDYKGKGDGNNEDFYIDEIKVNADFLRE